MTEQVFERAQAIYQLYDPDFVLDEEESFITDEGSISTTDPAMYGFILIAAHEAAKALDQNS